MSANDVFNSEFSHWELPDVTLCTDEDAADIFGRQASPVSTSVSTRASTDVDIESKEQEESILPPTLSEIEAIQQEAQQAGFEHGKAQGFGEGLEIGRLTGLEQGHKEGFVQGEAQGYEEGMKQAQAKIAQFEALLAQFTQPLAILDLEIEWQLISLVKQLAEGVIMHELTLTQEHILHLLRQGLNALPIKNEQITIRVNPIDGDVIRQFYQNKDKNKDKNKAQNKEQASQAWHIEDDPTVSQGGLMMRCEPSELDLSLEKRLKTVFSEWEQAQKALRLKKEQHIQQSVARTHEINDPDFTDAVSAIAANLDSTESDV
ncbi:flagellar assembly protein FliH [uncultured Shewanella sp.]|uniref:flagellar assembly protein FliH n=1 Tax=uncultured Shewanella sp. TaxID=173975 RepID=UPI002619D377|nr:flagellar assembly protein FliH [uncultured Shewanella sp.]